MCQLYFSYLDSSQKLQSMFLDSGVDENRDEQRNITVKKLNIRTIAVKQLKNGLVLLFDALFRKVVLVWLELGLKCCKITNLY